MCNPFTGKIVHILCFERVLTCTIAYTFSFGHPFFVLIHFSLFRFLKLIYKKIQTKCWHVNDVVVACVLTFVEDGVVDDDDDDDEDGDDSGGMHD